MFQQSVHDLIIRWWPGITGVRTDLGMEFEAATVVLTVGTFLAGRIHVGPTSSEGGRMGDAPANALAARLRDLPFRVERLKTGTPPRLDGRSIDTGVMQEQPGDAPVPVFSFTGDASDHPDQISCHITHTNERTHKIIENALDRSPLFSGAIEGTGPRYCPSIEDKVVRFADRKSHQIFVEPEGLNTQEVYPNGISTSLPFDVQWQLVRSIRGFENAVILRPGYAIEYDFFDPRDLKPQLETRAIEGLFLAGQINGTTGYEEAAGQGIIAGINAALKVRQKDPWWPRRDQAYIGVLIDDLITSGTSEPYRMFTSRAEYRLLLREDNADLRLTPIGRELGLVDETRWQRYCEKQESIEREATRLKSTWIRPDAVEVSAQIAALGQELSREANLMSLLKRPEVSYTDLMKLPGAGPGESDIDVREQLEIQARYSGYIERQLEEIDRQKRNESTQLPEEIDYSAGAWAVGGNPTETGGLQADHRWSGSANIRRHTGSHFTAVGIFEEKCCLTGADSGSLILRSIARAILLQIISSDAGFPTLADKAWRASCSRDRGGQDGYLFAGDRNIAIGFQGFDHATDHFSRCSDHVGQFLLGDGIGDHYAVPLMRQPEDCAGYPAVYIQKCQIFDAFVQHSDPFRQRPEKIDRDSWGSLDAAIEVGLENP